jgi:hypothetical protein
MTRSIYLSSFKRGAIASLVVTSWRASLGTCVLESASDIMVDMALNDSTDSLPPKLRLDDCLGVYRCS